MKIPSTMATQHPDSATKLVPVREEVEEAIFSLMRENQGLGCDEYLIDYMGKLTPYHQIGEIVKALSKKTDLIPGKDVFLTPRMVSSFRDEPFRQLMTLSAVMEGIYNSTEIYDEPGVREMVHAMTTIEELKRTRERARSILAVLRRDLKFAEGSDIHIIPLFEGVQELLSLKEILPRLGKELGSQRLFLGKSETSLIYGHPASSLACKIALADVYDFERNEGTPFYTIFGGGALPFRGHITLENVDGILREFKGAKTFTIQSGMRYDHGQEKTRRLVERIQADTSRDEHLEFSEDELNLVVQSIAIFFQNYMEELLEIVDKVIQIATFVPNQRERLLESSDISYYQAIRNIQSFIPYCKDKEVRDRLANLDSDKLQNLPRVIRFTAALYTVGLPPEFLGTGYALKEIGEKLGKAWLDHMLEEVIPSLRGDLAFASMFLSTDPSQNILLTDRIRNDLNVLSSFVEFKEPESSYLNLCRVATSCIRDFWEGKNMMPQRFAVLLSDGTVSEYVDASIKENMAKLILDMGRIRGSLG